MVVVLCKKADCTDRTLAIPDIHKQSLSGALSMLLPDWNLRLELRDLSRPWHNMRWLPSRSAIARKCNLNSRLRLTSIEEQPLGVTEDRHAWVASVLIGVVYMDTGLL